MKKNKDIYEAEKQSQERCMTPNRRINTYQLCGNLFQHNRSATQIDAVIEITYRLWEGIEIKKLKKN